MTPPLTPLRDLPPHTYFVYKSEILRVEREGNEGYQHYLRVKKRSGEIEVLSGDQEVSVARHVGLRALVLGEVFSFDAWSLLESEGFKKLDAAIIPSLFNLLRVSSIEPLTLIGGDDREIVFPLVKSARPIRVYTKAHPPVTLQGAKVGTVFTRARAILNEVDVYRVVEVGERELWAVNELGRRVAVDFSTQVRIWTSNQGIKVPPRIAAMMPKEDAGPVMFVRDMPDYTYFERGGRGGQVMRKKGSHPVVSGVDQAGVAVQLPRDVLGVALTSLTVGQLILGARFTLDPAITKDPRYKGVCVNPETNTSCLDEELQIMQISNASMRRVYATVSKYYFNLPIFDDVRAYTSAHPREVDSKSRLRHSTNLSRLVEGEKFLLAPTSVEQINHLIPRSHLEYLTQELTHCGVVNGRMLVSVEIPNGVPFRFGIPFERNLLVYAGPRQPSSTQTAYFTETRDVKPGLKRLQDVPVGAYFSYDSIKVERTFKESSVYRRGDNCGSNVIITGADGKPGYWRGGTSVREVQFLNQRCLAPGEEFMFDAWSLNESGYLALPNNNSLIGKLRLVHCDRDQSNREGMTVVVPGHDREIFLHRPYKGTDHRVYTKMHPPETLERVTVGTVFTLAYALPADASTIYRVVEVGDGIVWAVDDRNKRCKIAPQESIRIWHKSQFNPPRIAAMLEAAEVLSYETLRRAEEAERKMDVVVVQPSCTSCKQPFGVYRKQFGTVCGDCRANGTSLANRMFPPKPVEEAKINPHHWEAWETPSYEGLN